MPVGPVRPQPGHTHDPCPRVLQCFVRHIVIIFIFKCLTKNCYLVKNNDDCEVVGEEPRSRARRSGTNMYRPRYAI